MSKYNSFNKLNADYESRFGKDWDRSCLNHDDEVAFVNACYALYPKEFKKRDGFKSAYMDKDSIANNARPFEIVSPIGEGEGWDLECLPAYIIRFADNEEEFEAYAEEIFEYK